MERESSNYGVMFADVLKKGIRSLVNSPWRRERNPGAPFRFGENPLRKEIRRLAPAAWPNLVVERKVKDDFNEPGKRHGGVDYFFVPDKSQHPWPLSEVLATCEVGGPTRPKLLSGSKDKWHRKIVADIRKQLWRARFAPNGEHYLGLLIKPGRHSAIGDRFPIVLKAMLEEVPEAELVETFCTELEDVDKLNVIVVRVLPKGDA